MTPEIFWLTFTVGVLVGLMIGLEVARRAYRETARLLSRSLAISDMEREMAEDLRAITTNSPPSS